MRLGKRLPNSTPKRTPNNDRIIVCLQIAFEHYVGPTVGRGLSIAPEFPQEAIDSGKVNLIGLSWQDYGGNAGMRRLMRVLDKHGVPATSAMSGVAVERYPDIVKDFTKAGHEIIGHSWGQDVKEFALSEEEERKNIRRCVDIISQVGGERPYGWVSVGGQLSDRTLVLLAEEGFSFSLDFKDDDVPYIVEVEGHRLVAIPNPYDINDIQQYAVAGNPPEDYVSFFKHTFDVLYEEGLEQPKIINAIVHPPLFGRPFGAWAYEEVIRYAKTFPNVWFARRREVADWVLSNYKASRDK